MKVCSLLRLLASFAALPIGAFQCTRLRATRSRPRLRAHGPDRDGTAGSAARRCDEGIGRRSLLHAAGWSLAGTASAGPVAALGRLFRPDAVRAMGLVQFPCPPGALANTYHVLRAGESGLEAEGVLSTNPLFLTNREDALTELGASQVEEACRAMMAEGINPSVVKYSLAAKCIDAANIVATTMMVGRNRIVPEFTFMDPRGAGLWDGKPLASTEAALWALDANDAGNEGRDGRPPATDDGTANETLFEQVTRLRQLMSVLETQYSGDTVLLIFPDGTSPALLSCLIAGIPLQHVHALNFVPGELRRGVTMDNANRLLGERISSPSYNAALARGQDELRSLRREEEQMNREEAQAIKSAVTPAPRSIATTSNEQNDMENMRHRARSDETQQTRRSASRSNDATEKEKMRHTRHSASRNNHVTEKEKFLQRTRTDNAQNTRHPASRNDDATEKENDYFSIGVIGALGCVSLAKGDEEAEGRLAPAFAATNSTGGEGAACERPPAAVPLAATGSSAVAPTDAARTPAATADEAMTETALPAQDLVEAAKTAIASAAFDRPPATATPGTTDYTVVASTETDRATTTTSTEATDGTALPEQDLVAAVEQAIAGAIFKPQDAAVAPAPESKRATPTEVVGAADVTALPARDLLEAAEDAIADAVFAQPPTDGLRAQAGGGVRVVNVADAAGTVNANLFEDVPVRPERELIAAAETAMEEYLSQDDGGEDWLTSMKDMMEE